MRFYFKILIPLFSALSLFGQTPIPAFSVQSQVCLGEELDIINSSGDATSYQWDLCPSDLSGAITTSNILTLGGIFNSFGLKLVQSDGLYYGFVTSRDNNQLFRLEYGDSLRNQSTDITIVEITLTGDGVSSPYDIDVVNQAGNWYGVVSNGNNTLSVLDFGVSLTNNTVPSVQYGSLGLDLPRGLEMVQESGNWVGIVSNSSGAKLTIVDFGTDLGSPSISTQDHAISDAAQLMGLSARKEGSAWDIIVVSFSDSELYRVHLDDLLGASSTVTEIVEPGLSLSSPSEVFIQDQRDSVFVHILNRSTGISLMVYENSIDSSPERAQTLGNGGAGGFGNMLAFDFIEVGIDVGGQALRFDTGDLFAIEFSNDCSGVELSNVDLTLHTPTGISYSTPGNKSIALFAFHSNGNQRWVTQNLTATSDNAPVISFSFFGQCISTTTSFTPTISGIAYSWDFDDDGIEDNDLENPDHQFLSTGMHTVRLDINDGTCNNFTVQEITIYPDPPTPTFTAPSNECKNTSISFTNITDESQHVGVLTYEWDFNGEGISTETNPNFSFDTPGTKQITLKSIIPGCENISSAFEIEISDGPTSAFNASSFSICETESITFTDQSTNNPISWEWDFDDGFSSNAQNPDHLFSDPGNFNVSLTVTDVLGCQNTLVQEVSVSSLPVVSFDFDVACTSSEGIQFMDLSTVSGADIVSRTWYIGDTPLAEAQDLQNPVLTFASEGTVNVRLETVSSTGCESSHDEDIQILAAPQPDFSMSIGCEGELSSFTDATLSPGNQITSRLWTLDGTNYTTEEINHTFSGPGIFEVILEVTGQNFCSETITKEIEVLELLTVDFSVDGDCSNELIELSDQSTVLQDPIVSREWSLDGTSVGNGSSLTLESLPDNTYELMLEVTTASGCVVNTTNNIVINRAPLSSISAPKTFGVPGDAITFTNESTGGSTYHWLFNGDSVSNNGAEETFQFSDPGTYEISMVADNDLGCSDTTTTSVLIAMPDVDLSIGQFEVVENEGKGTIFLEIQNNSNLPIDNTEVVIELENQFSVTEQITSTIGIGESQLVSLNVGVPLNSNELSYLCVALNSQYNGFDDTNPLDNEKCIALEPQIVVEAPFPNPVTDQVRVRLVAPSGGSTIITLLNSAGKVEMVHTPQTEEGLNNFFLDLKALTTGVYFIRIEISGLNSIQRIIKL